MLLARPGVLWTRALSWFSSENGGQGVQFSSVAQSCPIFCDPMNCSTPGLSLHHQLPEFTQTYVHRISDAIQPSHPLPSGGSQYGSSHPWQRSCGEDLICKGKSELERPPWTCPSIYPKTKICLFYYFMTFTNFSDINRGLSPTTFLWRKSTQSSS